MGRPRAISRAFAGTIDPYVRPEEIAVLRAGLRAAAPVLLGVFPFGLVQSGTVNLSLENTRMLAGLIAIAVAWRLRRTLLTIFAGMLALHLLAATGRIQV